MKSEKYRQRLSQKLAKAMEENKWNASDLSRLSGINTTSMNSYISGMSYPMKESREKIARGIFGVSPEELEADLEGQRVQRQKSAEAVCREIRLMDDDEFLEVHEEISKEVIKRFHRLRGQGLPES